MTKREFDNLTRMNWGKPMQYDHRMRYLTRRHKLESFESPDLLALRALHGFRGIHGKCYRVNMRDGDKGRYIGESRFKSWSRVVRVFEPFQYVALFAAVRLVAHDLDQAIA